MIVSKERVTSHNVRLNVAVCDCCAFHPLHTVTCEKVLSVIPRMGLQVSIQSLYLLKDSVSNHKHFITNFEKYYVLKYLFADGLFIWLQWVSLWFVGSSSLDWGLNPGPLR